MDEQKTITAGPDARLRDVLTVARKEQGSVIRTIVKVGNDFFAIEYLGAFQEEVKDETT